MCRPAPALRLARAPPTGRRPEHRAGGGDRSAEDAVDQARDTLHGPASSTPMGLGAGTVLPPLCCLGRAGSRAGLRRGSRGAGRHVCAPVGPPGGKTLSDPQNVPWAVALPGSGLGAPGTARPAREARAGALPDEGGTARTRVRRPSDPPGSAATSPAIDRKKGRNSKTFKNPLLDRALE